MPTETLPIPTDAGARDALLERVRALAALRHPCVEPVAAVDVRDDGTLTVRRGGAATDLPTVLGVRGRLTAREASGVLVACARGLAALHSAGLRQGAFVAGDVVLAPDGAALLRPRAVASAGGTHDPGEDGDARDVFALAELVGDLLGDRSDDDATALRAVLAPAAAPDPRVRPEAGTLAAQADAAVPPEPVRLPERAVLASAALGLQQARPRGASSSSSASSSSPRRRAVRRPDGTRAGPSARSRRRAPSRRTGARRSPGRRLGGVVGAVGVIGVAAVLTAVAVQVRAPEGPTEAPPATAGAVSAHAATDSPAADMTADGPADGTADRTAEEAADPTRDRSDPETAASELTRRRVELLSGDVSPDEVDRAQLDLGDVDLAGSPAHDADAALLDDKDRAGMQVRGAEVRVDDARTSRHEGDEADVVVRYAVGAHDQVAADGAVTAVPATGTRSATLRLAWTPDGWRVAGVE